MSDDYNPYGADPVQSEGATLPLDEILKNAIDGKLYAVHTWLPVQVVKVYSNGLVDVQPLLKRKYIDGALIVPPVIPRIPVQHPRGADYWVKLPVAVNDYGRITFCERSLDSWSVQGGVVDPKDNRHHDLSDGVFVPGLYPNNAQIVGAATEMILHNGSAEIVLQKGGTFKVKNPSNELFDLLDQLMDTLINQTFTLTQMGPQPFISSTVTLLQAIKDKLDTLKGA